MTNKITSSEWRDCYYLYRTLHEGLCPLCGHVAEYGDLEDYMGNLACENIDCNFTITALESEVILSHSKEILEKRLNTFERVRSQLTLTEA